MAVFSVHPIGLTKSMRDLSQYTYRLNTGVPCEYACYTWVIGGSKPNIMVDAGDMSFAGETQIVKMEEGLAKLNLSPDDIKIIILTHLHVDHVSLTHMFKNARFIVQKKELDYALNPHPFEAYLYMEKMFANLNFEVIDGDKQIIPGVNVFLTPGHSPGGQSVEIQTAGGKTIITGFCCQLKTFEQSERMKQFYRWEVAIPLIHGDVREMYESVLAVKKRADLILANHDIAYVGKTVVP
jgi:N-acyl homoserine lactone hydrolase